MKLLKMLVTFIAATVLGAAGAELFGLFGGLVGSALGGVVGWWVARRLMPD